jgi:hypothetical protein
MPERVRRDTTAHPVPWATVATRMIVTSQPDVACDVCGRRLLRGEQPDVFLAGGRRRMVCELCAPRASAEGWRRETDPHALSLPAARPRRGRNLLGRLRQSRERADSAGEDALMALAQEPSTASYDFLDGTSDRPAELERGLEPVDADLAAALGEDPGPVEPHRAVQPVPAAPFLDATPAPAADEHVAAAPDPPEDAEGADEAEETVAAEEGSWRDAWMFVKE